MGVILKRFKLACITYYCNRKLCKEMANQLAYHEAGIKVEKSGPCSSLSSEDEKVRTRLEIKKKIQ
jgi:hypothetical protein